MKSLQAILLLPVLCGRQGLGCTVQQVRQTQPPKTVTSTRTRHLTQAALAVTVPTLPRLLCRQTRHKVNVRHCPRNTLKRPPLSRPFPHPQQISPYHLLYNILTRQRNRSAPLRLRCRSTRLAVPGTFHLSLTPALRLRGSRALSRQLGRTFSLLLARQPGDRDSRFENASISRQWWERSRHLHGSDEQPIIALTVWGTTVYTPFNLASRSWVIVHFSRGVTGKSGRTVFLDFYTYPIV